MLFRSVAISVRGEEYRYSERMRRRKQGAYDAVYRPSAWLDATQLTSADDVLSLLPPALCEKGTFTAEEFGRACGLREGRRRSAALSLLQALGLTSRHKDGKKFIYQIIKTVR